MKRGIALGLVVCAIGFLTGAGEAAAASADPTMTPGSADPAVTQATVQQTICSTGYADARPKVSSSTKSKVYAAYHIAKRAQSRYVIDHLIPAELGGSNETTNLWPQPKADASDKHRIALVLRDRVCGGVYPLAAAQAAVAADWSTALVTVTTTTPRPTGTFPMGYKLTYANGTTVQVFSYEQGTAKASTGATQPPVAGREFAVIDAEVCASPTAPTPYGAVGFKVQMPDGTMYGGSIANDREPKLGSGTLPAAGGCKRGLVTLQVPVGQSPRVVVWDYPGYLAANWLL